ncbi:MAG: T9SS type A sorting domain-containing protein [Bacteroidales bacterium]|nr:T9SS type A sorting domain-containing protein [Bacteroidales bacterium]
MKTILKLIFIFLSVIPAFSQESFRTEWEIEDNLTPIHGIVDNNGNTIIVGQIIKPQNNNEVDGFIFRMTPEGDYSYVRTSAPQDTNTVYNDIIQLDNGNYFILGRKGPTDFNGTNEQYKLIAYIFDENLNLIIEKEYNYNSTYKSLGFAGLLQEENGNILLAVSAERFTGSSSNKTDLGLFRFTQEGDTIETRFYHYQRNVYVYDFEKIPESDNYLILEFTTQLYGFFECYVLKPDLTAECINYYSSYDYIVSGDLSHAYWYPDKTFMMGSSMRISDNSTDKGLGVYRCDTLANISEYLFLNKVDTFDQHAYSQCMSYADENSIYITGYIWDYFNCENPDSIELYVVDTALNQVAYKSLGGDMSYDIFGVLTAKDGGAIIYGKAASPETDCYGNLVVYYVSRDELGLPPVQVFDIEEQEDNALVYPNPACDIVNIRIPFNGTISKITEVSGEITDGLTRQLWEQTRGQTRIKLYNSTGKKIYDYRLPNAGNTLQLNISNLNSGVYIYEITNDERVVSSGKFIRQ